ncbi:hypothetical protein K4L44_02500 [Halosquirtibacter laminarini]|uniref:Uncharacterized protein n=1 Tax=Halosquirtibacter laminarini TaxID=3374600 RepID=A0AC61NNW9_9BACT|nr:hypothetical protein K4L44_02500 [Prolixibacteraceae bacterium]
MKLSTIAETNQLTLRNDHERFHHDPDVCGLMVTDLMSHAMANGGIGMAFVTIQAHRNVLAVALLKEFSAIIIPYDIEIPENLLKEANIQEMPIYSTPKSTYELVGNIYQQLSSSS